MTYNLVSANRLSVSAFVSAKEKQKTKSLKQIILINKSKKMQRSKLVDLYKKYDLKEEDFFTHQHYTIITRQGIDKIQAIEQIFIDYEVIKCETNFAVFKR